VKSDGNAMVAAAVYNLSLLPRYFGKKTAFPPAATSY
jgi:hypothetical protein